jgi:hypothetical protein
MDVETNAVVEDEYTIKAWEEIVPLGDVLNKKEWHSRSYKLVKFSKGSYKGP